ncbi:basic proline-rich protein-like [Molossus molossus]|uniref:basic proline-rich protein-like n=1 Tax=Molossus molossus TaxID=27622 RepID=UPI0017471C0D|nr:basic proline-rich protein-like [Molossus molossus]
MPNRSKPGEPRETERQKQRQRENENERDQRRREPEARGEPGGDRRRARDTVADETDRDSESREKPAETGAPGQGSGREAARKTARLEPELPGGAPRSRTRTGARAERVGKRRRPGQRARRRGETKPAAVTATGGERGPEPETSGGEPRRGPRGDGGRRAGIAGLAVGAGTSGENLAGSGGRARGGRDLGRSAEVPRSEARRARARKREGVRRRPRPARRPPGGSCERQHPRPTRAEPAPPGLAAAGDEPHPVAAPPARDDGRSGLGRSPHPRLPAPAASRAAPPRTWDPGPTAASARRANPPPARGRPFYIGACGIRGRRPGPPRARPGPRPPPPPSLARSFTLILWGPPFPARSPGAQAPRHRAGAGCLGAPGHPPALGGGEPLFASPAWWWRGSSCGRWPFCNVDVGIPANTLYDRHVLYTGQEAVKALCASSDGRPCGMGTLTPAFLNSPDRVVRHPGAVERTSLPLPVSW